MNEKTGEILVHAKGVCPQGKLISIHQGKSPKETSNIQIQLLLISGIYTEIRIEKRWTSSEQSFQNMRSLSPFELSQVMEEYSNMYICPVCPNLNTCAMSTHEWFYCFNGRSFIRIDFEQTCICKTCPVQKKTGLKQSFFCARGAETAQRYEHTIRGTKTI